MKNPFKKQNHNGLIATLVIGSIAAGAIAYLYFTETGNETRKHLKKKAKAKAKDLAADILSKKTGLSKKFVRKTADVAVK
jgi:hypothetical protein